MKKPVKNEAPTGEAGRFEPLMRSREQRLAAGVALRETVPHQSHAGWKRPAKRRDPIDVLKESDRDRLPERVPIRYGRMLASPFTFLRGSAGLMSVRICPPPRPPAFGCRPAGIATCSTLACLRPGARKIHLRHERLRRNPARAVGVGRQAPGGQFCGSRPRQSPHRQGGPGGGGRVCARVPRAPAPMFEDESIGSLV